MSLVGDVANAITQPVKAVTQPIADLLNRGSSSSSSSTGAASGASGASSTQSNITNAQNSLAGDQQMFLKLLTAQLKNQDPLSPMDANQFTQQLVVMNGVQQQILTNQLLEQLVNQKTSMGDPVNLIGKRVTAATSDSVLQGGKADWIYSLDGASKQVNVQVLDNLGRVVFQQDMSQLPAGEQAFSWNGKDLNGNQRADGGTYTLKVTAADASGTAVTTHIFQRGITSSVETADGQSLINLNGLKLPLSAVTAVGAAA